MLFLNLGTYVYEKPYSIFLDFVKAFDTVSHDILLEKLKYHGIRGLPLNWFKSYLSSRYQCVKIDNAKSYKAVVCGVPQESVSGPLFFLIYISNIYKWAPHFCFHSFADDTCLLYTNKSLIFHLITLQTCSWRVNWHWIAKSQISLLLTLVKTVRKSYLLIMRNLSKKTSQNTWYFIFINSYHGRSTLKSQITNFIHELAF